MGFKKIIKESSVITKKAIEGLLNSDAYSKIEQVIYNVRAKNWQQGWTPIIKKS